MSNHHTTHTCEHTTLNWQIHVPLMSYLRQLADFTLTEIGSGRYLPHIGLIVRDALHYSANPDSATHAAWEQHNDGRNGIVLQAHAGAFTLHLTSLQITQDALWIIDPLSPTSTRLRLVDLTLDRTNTVPGTRRYTTRLHSNAEPLFAFTYPPGTEFADLTLTCEKARP